ncbi:MAG: hypothetical protein Phog2KO_39930 [Phototrophicaceae bacterium]
MLKLLTMLISLFIALLSFFFWQDDTATETDALEIDGWELVWNDEFEGDAIDRTNWGFNTGGSGFGNNELQFYTDDPENAFVEDGLLVIQATNERTMGLNYGSAKLWTLGLHTWQYGRFDIRARLPEGQGIWPAFWMLPMFSEYGGWPHGGEIDIMELLGHEPDTVHGTLHYSDADGHVYSGTSYTLDEGTFHDDFHIFSIIWEEGQIQWFVDGELYQTQNQWQTRNADYPAPFDQEFYLMINLAVGGNWPGSPDETTIFPQRLEVDYVRVYQESE